MQPARPVETPTRPERPHPAAKPGRLALAAMVAWLLLTLAFWALFVAFQAARGERPGYHFLYYHIMFGLVGLPLWLARRPVAAALQSWRLTGLAKFLLLGYAMVLLEETFAALVNHLAEGFEPSRYLLRVGQFWAFNILAFTGLVVAWSLLPRLFRYGPREAFFLVGLFGLFAEHTINLLAGSVLLFILLAPLNLFVYGLILSPALLSVPEAAMPARRSPWPIRYPLALLLPLLLSIPPVILLAVLRANFPDAFPPCVMISCS